MLLLCIFLFPSISYGQNISPLKRKNVDEIKNTLKEYELIDTLYKVFKKPQKHKFELSISGIYSLDPNHNEYKFLTDVSMGVGYRYLHPLRTVKRYLYISTSHHIGSNFVLFQEESYKKYSYLSYYEIGLYRPEITHPHPGDVSWFFAGGILNYNYYSFNSIYIIDKKSELNELKKLNAKFLSLRVGVYSSADKWCFSMFYLFNFKHRKYAYVKIAGGISVVFPLKFSKNEKT